MSSSSTAGRAGPSTFTSVNKYDHEIFSAVADRKERSARGGARGARGNDSDDDNDDEIFEQLEAELDDDFMADYREQRLEQLKRELETVRAMKEDDHGRLGELKVEKEVIQAPLKNKRTVIHFYHPDFRRCKLMDTHLEKLAAKHFNTKFLRVDVANVPFLVVKLEIKVLPCVIAFIDGVTKDKIVGFEEVGDGTGDSFTTAQLELRLSQSGVIEPLKRDGAVRRPNFS